MYKAGFVVVAFVAACGSSTEVGTSSTPPSGGADAGITPPARDAGSIEVDGGAADAGGANGVADGGATGVTDAGASGVVDGGAHGVADGGAVDGGGATGDGGGGVAACTLPGPTQLASAPGVSKLLVDGDQVYYLVPVSGLAGFYRVPKAGGTPTLLAYVTPLGNDGVDWDFAVGDTAIYLIFTTSGPMGLDSNVVTVIDKASGATRFVPVHQYGCTRPAFTRVTAAGGTAWLLQQNNIAPRSTCTEAPFDTIEALPSGATHTQTVATLARGTTAIAADAADLFWSGAQGTFRARHDGSSVEAMAPVTASQLVSDGHTLFAAVGSSVDAITAPQQLTTIYDGAWVASPIGPAAALAVDDTRVWVGTPSAVVAVGKDGAAPRTVVPQRANSVAVDATRVYYGAVMTACK